MVIVTITNNSASPISNWAICFDYADSIENIWDAVIEANQGTIETDTEVAEEVEA